MFDDSAAEGVGVGTGEVLAQKKSEPRRSEGNEENKREVVVDKKKLRERIIRRLMKMKYELTQLIIDKEWWNQNRTDAMPFDLGWERVLLDLVVKQLRAWHTGDMAEVQRLASKLDAVDERSVGDCENLSEDYGDVEK